MEDIYDCDLCKAAESFEDDINLTSEEEEEEEEAKTTATAKFTISNPWKRRYVQLLSNSKRCFRKQRSIMAVISVLITKAVFTLGTKWCSFQTLGT